MKIIPVKIRGVLASKPMLVDNEDYGFLNETKWCEHDYGYAVSTRHGKSVYAHRLILDIVAEMPPGRVTDHEDGNPLNNQKSNLRVCHQKENTRNKKISRNNTSGFKGVFKNKKKWSAQITAEGKVHCLGSFSTPEEAHEAYKEAAKKFHGEFAKW